MFFFVIYDCKLNIYLDFRQNKHCENIPLGFKGFIMCIVHSFQTFNKELTTLLDELIMRIIIGCSPELNIFEVWMCCQEQKKKKKKISPLILIIS